MVAILLSCLLHAGEDAVFSPMQVESLSAVLVNEGSVSATSGEIYDAELNISIPQETSYQRVRIEPPPGSRVVDDGQSKVLVVASGPSKARSFTYRVVSYTNTTARYISSLPPSYSTTREHLPYLQESAHVLLSDDIAQEARSIAQYYTEDIDKVAALAIWVNRNMRYDLSLVGGNRTSIDSYVRREGVCVDYTNLFLAMSRSLGYPSRSVLGYVYSPEYGWQLHSWAEVYIGEWVGVDPTWLEVGYIDATHIPMYFGNDTEYIEYANAHLTDSRADILWQGRGSLGQPAEGISIQSFRTSSLPYEAVSLPGNLSIGSNAAIVLSVTSPDYRIFTMDIAPCAGDPEIVRFEEKSITQFLHPGMNNIVVPFSVSGSLSDSYTYTCPIVLSHSFGANTVTVNVTPGPLRPPVYAQLASLNATEAVVRIVSTSGGEVTIIEDHAMGSITMPPSFTYEYRVNMTGKREARVAVHSGSWSDVIIITSPGASSRNGQPYSISSFSASGYVPTDREGRLTLSIDVPAGTQPLSVRIYEDGQLQATQKPAGPTYTIDYAIQPRSIGRHKGRVVIDTGFDQYEHDFSYEVFEPEVAVRVSQEDGEYTFEVEGPVKSYTLYIDGKKADQHKRIQLPEGRHEIRVEWVDLAGYSRVHTEQLDNSPLAGCVGPAAVITVC
ncbi:MAG: transglutaminase-like domain-containing protein, partial [Candidatus Micrarchaeota archaeon]|nr:transglutaminase-like domain-containing protein [Candidatus Micrarchaeota archaeon]